MVISDVSSMNSGGSNQSQKTEPNDIISMERFNSLPGPVTAKFIGGDEYWIETLDVQTGCMRIDVCGQIDLKHFSEVKALVDGDGKEHDPDDFYLDN